MAEYISVSFTGMPSLLRKLERLAREAPLAAAQALRVELDIEMTEAKRRTPVRTGALRDSGTVDGPHKVQGGYDVRMFFGGPAAPYAVYVHENLEAIHPVGQAKFLESTLQESAPYLAQRVADRMAEFFE